MHLVRQVQVAENVTLTLMDPTLVTIFVRSVEEITYALTKKLRTIAGVNLCFAARFAVVDAQSTDNTTSVHDTGLTHIILPKIRSQCKTLK